MTQWVRREFSTGDIDRAGAVLRLVWTGESAPDANGVEEAYGVVENWRMCHAYPLNAFQVMLRSRARRADRAKASVALARIERRPGIGSRLDAVLVWVPDARHLRAAYPNYYADTREFLTVLDEVLRSEGRRHV